jgi:DNA polymerase-2
MIFSMEGFLVHAWPRTRGGRTVLYLVGRLSDGRTFAAMEGRHRPWFCVRRSEAEAARRLAELSPAAGWGEAGLTTMDGEACLRVSFATAEARQKAREALAAAGLRTYEADLRVADQFRLERRIHGSLRLRGPYRAGRHVDLVFLDPELEPAEWQPKLSVLSIDIETELEEGAVLAVGLAHRDPFREDRQEVLYAGGRLRPGEAADPAIQVFASEAEMLAAFARRLRELDPDVITGWNVVDFDLRALADRFRLHGLPFRLGRSDEEAAYLPANAGRASRAVVPGRQVWDAVRIVRAAPEHYEDYTLETVAETVLGYGKRLRLEEGERRLEAIGRLAREDPEEFCRYCLQDARLVQEIFDKTGLIELTLHRCQLTGVAPDLAWTSIPAFEHLYIEAMHERGVAAPTAGVDPLPLDGAPGGGILTPRPGVYDRVLLFDFQSLYPTIMRSFNLDPLGYVRPGQQVEGEDLIEAPNGARFRREPAILPALLDRFFESRRQARERGDLVASFVYKIIMNSFYGVLGASGCRFAGSQLAGAITSFGQHILTWCRDYLEAGGRQVIYGDTDSLFVLSPQTSGDAPGASGPALAAEVNAALARYLEERWRVGSRLLLEFEKVYERFFLPPMRGEELGSKGRAKSYAGLEALPPGAEPEPPPGEPRGVRPGAQEAASYRQRIEVKGMEAVRRDWTDLAHEFQLRLLELLFRREPLPAFRQYVAGVLRDLSAGRLDGKLVYRKALRKPVADYTRNTPPHVKAAELLPPGERRGLIRYLVTAAGPQPAGRLSAPIDYAHYVEKQLKPIASAFTETLGTDLEPLFGGERPLRLF